MSDTADRYRAPALDKGLDAPDMSDVTHMLVETTRTLSHETGIGGAAAQNSARGGAQR